MLTKELQEVWVVLYSQFFVRFGLPLGLGATEVVNLWERCRLSVRSVVLRFRVSWCNTRRGTGRLNVMSKSSREQLKLSFHRKVGILGNGTYVFLLVS